MKKNLRIVSVAAAALLAVAPVAATAMPVNAATTATTTATTTNKPTVDLSGAGSVSESKDTVIVTPSFTLNSATKSTPATLKGSIEASLNGTSVTADVADVAQNVTLTTDDSNNEMVYYSYDAGTKKVKNNLSAVKPGDNYFMTLKNVGFSFGKANANKTLTFKFKGAKAEKVTLDQYGNATRLEFGFEVKAYNSEDTSTVSFYDKKSGLVATQGSDMTLADENGDLNVNTLLPELSYNKKNGKGKYEAMQFKNGSFNPVTVTTTTDDVKAELEKAGIKVSDDGSFEAPDTFTVTLNAKSDVNGKTASLPVVVTVPNGKSTVVPSAPKTIMHNAYYYDKDAKRVGTDKVTRYNTVTVAMNPTKLANGISYYEVIESGKATGKYINADNIDGTKRTLKHNAYVYKSSKKRVNKVVLKKGTEVTTYGGSYKFKNGKKYYKIGADTKKTYVRVENFD
ncbi:SLAP domain-containing protein [Lactobacillus helveticus]|uniref:SLAP domain-containing protein n=1 Tax=Lactobacillus helveticus TaxID=1587 RepID=UPI001564A97E|nr:SLAP domain-containing protein [Lactobacillus helveticus]NRO37582.1 S-layer protein [Lactobacillus helveticus]